jgi:hypothetical protein
MIMQRHLIVKCETFQHYALTWKHNAGRHEKQISLLKVKPKHRAINKPTETKAVFSLSQKLCLLAWTEAVSTKFTDHFRALWDRNVLLAYFSYFEKLKQGYAITTCKLLNAWTNLYETWYVYHGTWSPSEWLTYFPSVCVSICVHPYHC